MTELDKRTKETLEEIDSLLKRVKAEKDPYFVKRTSEIKERVKAIKKLTHLTEKERLKILDNHYKKIKNTRFIIETLSGNL
jgi:DNA-binding protein H-NS